jgi:TetR/AcrR family transcriptional regulator
VKTASVRRMGVEGSETRAQLIEATEQLLREEGHAALTARQVAAQAGIKPQLLYYYFRTMDDLVLAVVRQIIAKRSGRFEQALLSPQPLRALWGMNSDPSGALLGSQLISLAGHREAIRAEIVRSADQFRSMQIAAVSRLLDKYNVDETTYSAAGIVMLMVGLGRAIVTESVLGVSVGHVEALELMEQTLQQIEGERAPEAAPRLRRVR